MESKKLQVALEKWNALQPLSDTDKFRLSRKFSVDFNYNSNHIEGNTLTYGQTELLLLFGKVIGEADVKDVLDMTASRVCLKMTVAESVRNDYPLTQNFIRTLHHTLLREDYTVYRTLPGGVQTSYVVHAGQYKTRPNSVITRYGDRFDYASPEETPALMAELVDWYNQTEQDGFLSPAEKELQRRLRVEPRARWIKMVPHGLPPRYDPSVEDSRAFAEGRLLVLSSFPGVHLAVTVGGKLL